MCGQTGLVRVETLLDWLGREFTTYEIGPRNGQLESQPAAHGVRDQMWRRNVKACDYALKDGRQVEVLDEELKRIRREGIEWQRDYAV